MRSRLLNAGSRPNPVSVSLPRHDHPLQPRLRTIAARAVVEYRDAKTGAPIAMRATQTELQIIDEGIRRHPMPALQEPRRKLHAALARTATITSCAARSPSRSHRSPFVSSKLMRTNHEHPHPTSTLFVAHVQTGGWGRALARRGAGT